MRIGQNPAKFVETVPQPARVTVAIITYIPFLEGYYRESLDVLKACLGSLWSNTRLPYDLMVFDQASCGPVRDFLREKHAEGRIQYLTFSDKNVGKAAGWNYVFAAAPGEIVAYADADIYFEPGWLTALVKVLDAYPEAGMVTGIPMWSPSRHSTATFEWAKSTKGVTLKEGKLLPWEDYWRHARSLGQDEATARANFDGQVDLMVIDNRTPDTAPRSSPPVPRPQGSPALDDSAPGTLHAARFYIGAGHFQFVARKSVLQEVLPIPADRPMGQVRRLDDAINARGYLRLSTPEWWVLHMGNTLTVTGKSAPAHATAPEASGKRLRGPARRFIQWLYHKTFEILYKP